MIGLVRRHIHPSEVASPVTLPGRAPIVRAAERKTQGLDTRIIFPHAGGNARVVQRRLKRRVKDIQALSESLLVSRALRMIRGGISFLDYGIQPVREDIPEDGIGDYDDAITQFDGVLQNPSVEDDDFGTWVGRQVESLLMYDAACWEYVEKPKYIEGNDVLALEPIPGYTIARNMFWDGDPDVARWFQIVGRQRIPLLNSDIEYIMQRPRADQPFGLSQVETVIEVMEAWLGLSAYQREVASKAYPAFLVYMGEVDDDRIQDWRTFWHMEVRGRSEPQAFGNTQGEPKTLQLKAITDEGLYPAFEEKLRGLVALAFDLRPMDFGIERDVNRSTAEVSRERSIEEARRPLAELIAQRINARLRPRIAQLTGNPLINEVEFFWIGLNPTDEDRDAEIHRKYIESDAVKIDEIRAERDLPPLPNGVGQMTVTPYREFMKLDLGNSLLQEPLAQETAAVIQASLSSRWRGGRYRSFGRQRPYLVRSRSTGRVFRGGLLEDGSQR